MRVLGVDFGGQRIGIAVGESDAGITTARPAIPASGTLAKDARAIAGIAKTEQAEAVVLGLPLQDEEESRLVGVCWQLADRLREQGLVVHLVDEAFTSVEAESNLLATGMKASTRRRFRDGEAARLILERFFDEKGS